MTAGDIKCYCEPKSCPARILIAGFIQPEKWLEHLVAHFLSNPWSIVVDSYGQPSFTVIGSNRHVFRVAE